MQRTAKFLVLGGQAAVMRAGRGTWRGKATEPEGRRNFAFVRAGQMRQGKVRERVSSTIQRLWLMEKKHPVRPRGYWVFWVETVSNGHKTGHNADWMLRPAGGLGSWQILMGDVLGFNGILFPQPDGAFSFAGEKQFGTAKTNRQPSTNSPSCHDENRMPKKPDTRPSELLEPT